MPRSPVRVLFYAINGTGLGHLSRLHALGRAARELSGALGARADLRFLTTSDASEVVSDFPVYKLPSKTAAVRAGADRAEFVATGKLLISNLVGGFRPDVLVMDTVPQGAFQEFAFLKSYARAALLVDRHKDVAVASSEIVQKHLALYDRIVVPDWPEERERYPAPRSIRDRRRFVGPLHGFRPELALTRDELHAHFDIPGDRRVVYVSAGGGGDEHAPPELERLVEAIATDPRLHLLVGYGPLFRGRRIYRANVTPLGEPDVSRFFGGVDAAVSAAGYNTYQELLAAVVPTIFYAQHKGMDRQDERVKRGVARGWHDAFDSEGARSNVAEMDPTLIRSKVAALLEGEKRAGILAALERRPEAPGATRAAAELLALHSSLPDSPIDRQKLYEAAALRLAWQGAREPTFVESARAFLGWRALASSRTALDDATDRAAAAWHRGIDDAFREEARRALDWGAELLSLRRRADIDEELWHDLLAAYCSSATGQSLSEIERRQRLGDTLSAIAEHVEADQLGALMTRALDSVKRAELAGTLDRIASELDAEPDQDAHDLISRVVGR